MGRKSTGTVRLLQGEHGKPQWHARWTQADGTRNKEWFPLDPKIAPDDRAGAEACAARMAPGIRLGSLTGCSGGSSGGESVRQWFKRLHAAKEAKGFSTVKDMRGRAKRWVFPTIGDKDMRAITRQDGERVVATLDKAVAAFMKQGPGKGRLAPPTAANVWGDLLHAFDEAVNAKDEGLRVLKVNPLDAVRAPDAGEDRQGQILYSDELLALLRGVAANPDTIVHVPLYRRQAYAMAVYTKGRSSELEALTVDDVDLAHGTIKIAKQADRASKGRVGTKQTKTKRVRTVDIEPHLHALVKALVEYPQGKGKRLLHMPPPEDRAELLRKDLRTVGVVREALHIEHDPLQRAITFHDLRDTGLTHMAVRGDEPIVIQWAGGHTDFKTTQGYLDRGKTERRRIGEPLPPLPPDIAPISPRALSEELSSRSHSGNLRPQRELNPCYRRERPVS
jgi:integrase